MGHNTNKLYYEYLAKSILENYLPLEFSGITLSDKPDLINSNGDGIEVTRALFVGDGESSGRFQKIKNKPKEEIDERDLTRLRQLDCEVLYINGKAGGYVPPAQWCTLMEIQRAFTDKLSKVDSYRNTSMLFIYSPMFDWYEPELVEEFTKWAVECQCENEKKYLKVYVFEYTALYICDLVSRDINILSLEPDIVKMCCESAAEYVYSMNT